ncbi:MAG: ChbG/HpnK family deacetylase [Gemmatimonadaceae bacterium]
MTPLRTLSALLLASALLTGASDLAAQAAIKARTPEVLFRLDDVGMNHSVNTAIARVAETGIPFSVSVMFACPWYEEAVELLKRHPQIAVGVHLVLNSEWRNYRWGPVLGKAGVPTLTDSAGYFLPSTTAFLASKYDLGEVERELGAQLDRAVSSGLKIRYVDFHMGTAGSTPQLRAVVERLARKYGVGISRYYGEASGTLFDTPVASKTGDLLDRLAKADPSRTNLVVVHVADRTPEMSVLFDRNNAAQNSSTGTPLVANHRQAELDAMLSPELATLVRSGKVKLVTYADLVARAGPVSTLPRP